MRLKLNSGNLQVELDPGAGGSVSAMSYGGRSVLRAAPPRTGPAYDPLAYAGFPMVPFVGRIFEGSFQVGDDQISLPLNFPPEPHAVHGHGWQAPWRVTDQTNTRATLVYNHIADAWPWDYTAAQSFRTEAHRMILDMSVTNQGETAMPAGFGWHPYFTRAGAQLTIPTTHEWFPDAVTGDNIPQPVTPATTLATPRTVAELDLDTTFSVGDAPIRLEWPTHAVTLASDVCFRHVTVYVPKGEDYFCVEPITQAPNAVNSKLDPSLSGLQWVAPGDTLSGTIELRVES
ncbi:MAG: aldose 1-epimerase [Pseudomonadota bacterium]